jgi:hypothetical protein
VPGREQLGFDSVNFASVTLTVMRVTFKMDAASDPLMAAPPPDATIPAASPTATTGC